MKANIVSIANRTIPAPSGVEFIKSDFITDDIIKQVLSQYEKHKGQLKAFAPNLQGSNVYESCKNIWTFWQQNIRYQKDNSGAGQQLVKSPAAVWADKFCDCKSFSIAVAACCYHLGIKCVFRFVSFPSGIKTIPTHVYVVAFDNGREIKIDCCLKKFDVEQTYSAKYDYLSKGIYNINGPDAGNTNPHKKRGCLCLAGVETEAELELMIRKQQVELEQQKAAKIHGIGSVHDNSYEMELAAINNAICEVANPRLKRYFRHRQLKPAEKFIGSPAMREEIAGKAERQAKRAAKKAKKVEKKTAKAVAKNNAGKALNKKQASLVEKTGAVVNKRKEGILKKIAKVVTAPVRLVQKGMLEATLPKSAPAFLYVFINDPKVLAKAPKIVIEKRNKALAQVDRITNKIGMKKDHLMGILRNGIMQNMGDTPENIVAGWMRDAGFQIGVITDIIQSAMGVLGNLVGGKAAQLMADAPDPSDWGIVSDAAAAYNLQQQYSNVQTSIPVGPLDNMYNTTQTPTYQYSGGAWNTDTAPSGGWGSYNDGSKQDYDADEFGEGDFGERNYEGKELDEAVVTTTKKSGSDNTLLIVGGVLLAAMALSKSSSRKKKAA